MAITGVTPMLRAADLRRTIDFYTEVLGFTVDAVWPEDDPQWCSLDHGGAHLMFYAEDPHDASPPKMTGRLYLYTDDVTALYEAIKDRVEVVEGPEVYHYGMKEIAILDPDGYCLAFGQPTDEAPACPGD